MSKKGVKNHSNNQIMLDELEELINSAKYDECLIKISELMEKYGAQLNLMCMLVKCYFSSGDYERAMKWCDNILKTDPCNMYANESVARILLMMGKKDDALGIWQKLLIIKNKKTSSNTNKYKELIDLYSMGAAEECEQEEKEIETIGHLELLSLLYQKGAAKYLEEKNRLESISIRRIRRKKKVRIAFGLYDSSMWCGDELYNWFANDPRFETVVYLSKRKDECGDTDEAKSEWYRQINEMKNRKINVVPIDEENFQGWKEPDIFITMNPYDVSYPRKLDFSKMNFSTLLIYIPYACFLWDTKDDGERSYNIPIVNMAWKVFIENEWARQYFASHMDTGFINGEASGWPRLDAYYRTESQDQFIWKEAVKNSKKIVYAPHWSINEGCTFATFQHNYKVLYKYARTHNEISWVIKPHPNLLHASVKAGVFENEREALSYFKHWDELPNARLVTGGDYQKIFASSDAMILDSCSFIEEYQYTGKPMLYLTRPEADFLPLALKILQNNYTVDGRDVYGIVEFIHDVVIEGNDFKKKKRSELFKQELDYIKRNSMLAGEYIYKSVVKSLYPES